VPQVFVTMSQFERWADIKFFCMLGRSAMVGHGVEVRHKCSSRCLSLNSGQTSSSFAY
jgi:hypothetical protein